MIEDVESVARLLHEAATIHHAVYRISDGDDADWASWYADWLLNLSELPQLLDAKPVRSHLVHALVQLERDFASQNSGASWEHYYAEGLVRRFGAR